MLNDNLEQQIKTIFTFQFLQNANTEWKQQSLAELSEMYQPKTISGKDLIAAGNYFVYGANGIIGKYNQYNHSGLYPLCASSIINTLCKFVA